MTTYDILTTDQAEIDIQNIDDYISTELLLPDSALNIVRAIRRKINSLSIFPERGTIYKKDGWKDSKVRLVKVKNYVVLFIVDKKARTVIILHVAYSKQDLDKLL